MSIAASRLQQRRMDQERVFHQTQSFLDQHNNTQRLHDWESRSKKQNEQREIDAITQKLLEQEEHELDQRKQQLQSLYNNEMSQWKDKLQSSLEVTQEQKMEMIRAKAYKLKAKREAERQVLVREAYERQWRDSCDDLRALDSKATLDRIVKDREKMIAAKASTKLSEEQGAQVMSFIHDEENDEQSQRRHQSSIAFKRALDQQVQWKRSHADQLATQKRYEEQEELRQLANLEQMARDSAKESITLARKGGQEMLEELEMKKRVKEDMRTRTRHQNMMLLEHALDQEKRQIEQEALQREVGKEAASEYVQCLRDQEQLEERENEYIKQIRDAEQQRLNKINDNRRKAEAEKQRRWQEEVDTSRQEQIQRKRIEMDQERKEMDQEAANIRAALIRAEEADKLDDEKKHSLRIETMLENRKTIDARAQENEALRKEKFYLRELMKNDQRDYQQRLQKQKSHLY